MVNLNLLTIRKQITLDVTYTFRHSCDIQLLFSSPPHLCTFVASNLDHKLVHLIYSARAILNIPITECFLWLSCLHSNITVGEYLNWVKSHFHPPQEHYEHVRPPVAARNQSFTLLSFISVLALPLYRLIKSRPKLHPFTWLSQSYRRKIICAIQLVWARRRNL